MTEHGANGGTGAPTLRVIGAGFGRTGTLSLRAALVRLGFGPCDHMQENFDRPERFALWLDAHQRKQRGEPIDWRPLLDGYQAIVDWLGAAFWQELAAAHPDAGVILTVRDPDRWYDSVRATVYRLRAWRDGSLAGRVTLAALVTLFPPLRHGLRVADEIIWDGTFSGQFTDKEHALAVSSLPISELSRMRSLRGGCSSWMSGTGGNRSAPFSACQCRRTSPFPISTTRAPSTSTSRSGSPRWRSARLGPSSRPWWDWRRGG
ncbi:MAG: sulfotransferase [Thermomicrobiales bacterium]